jgi:hypothetical protein
MDAGRPADLAGFVFWGRPLKGKEARLGVETRISKTVIRRHR